MIQRCKICNSMLRFPNDETTIMCGSTSPDICPLNGVEIPVQQWVRLMSTIGGWKLRPESIASETDVPIKISYKNGKPWDSVDHCYKLVNELLGTVEDTKVIHLILSIVDALRGERTRIDAIEKAMKEGE